MRLGTAVEKAPLPPDLTLKNIYVVSFVPKTKLSSAVPPRITAVVSFRERVFRNENQLC